MCTSWPVTPSSCLTSASRWPPRAPRAWLWPPHPAPPTAAPQTEPMPLNWLNQLKEWVGAASPSVPIASHLAVKNPREKSQTTARGGWEVMDRFGRETHVILHPSHVHSRQPTCPRFSKGWHCSGGQSPGQLTQQGAKFDTVLVKNRVQCLAFFFFCLKKKEKIKRKYRTASARPDGKDCRRPNTHMHSHIHPCMSHSGPR